MVRYANIERCCQLHETLEITYTVLGYSVTLLTGDGQFIAQENFGETIHIALHAMNTALSGVTLDQIRLRRNNVNRNTNT